MDRHSGMTYDTARWTWPKSSGSNKQWLTVSCDAQFQSASDCHKTIFQTSNGFQPWRTQFLFSEYLTAATSTPVSVDNRIDAALYLCSHRAALDVAMAGNNARQTWFSPPFSQLFVRSQHFQLHWLSNLIYSLIPLNATLPSLSHKHWALFLFSTPNSLTHWLN